MKIICNGCQAGPDTVTLNFTLELNWADLSQFENDMKAAQSEAQPWTLAEIMERKR